MIDSTANKYKESGKDSWMTSQTKPVSGGKVISTAGQNMNSKLINTFGEDSVTKNIYKGHLSGGNVIKDSANHQESHPITKMA